MPKQKRGKGRNRRSPNKNKNKNKNKSNNNQTENKKSAQSKNANASSTNNSGNSTNTKQNKNGYQDHEHVHAHAQPHVHSSACSHGHPAMSGAGAGPGHSHNHNHGHDHDHSNCQHNHSQPNHNHDHSHQKQNQNQSQQSQTRAKTGKQQTKKIKISPAMQKKNAGNNAFQREDYPLAIQYYTEAISLDENEHTLYSNRSAAYVLNKQFEEALQDSERCIELKPEWEKGYVRKGAALCKMSKIEQAQETYLTGKQLCEKTDLIEKALNDLDIMRMNELDESERIVGGHHAQADKFRTLISWLIQGGAQFPKLYLKFYSPEYRAIHALDSIHVDEDICFIPHDYIMTSDVAKQSEIGRKILAAKVELRSKHSYLASYLLQERELGEKSKWYVYITILPRKFETIPLFFSAEQREALVGSIAIKKIDDRLESLRLEHESICKGVPEFSRFTLNDFIWARLVVITRIFGLVVNDNKTDGLVPMADMLNHKRPRETKWTYSQPRRGFLITALQNIGSNAEIFDSYGRKCNSRFFVNYGFSLEFNLDNEALMSFELPRSDPQFAIKAHHLGYSGQDVVKRGFQIPMQYKEKKVKECFSFLRVLHAQGNEFLIISSSDGLKVTDIPPLSVRNEQNVLTSLAVAATRSLNKFETKLAYDNALLADEERYPRFANDRNAILMRRGEKEVLTHYVELRKICMQLFKLRYKDLRVQLRRDKRFRNPDSPLMMYVNTIVVPLVQRTSI